MSDLLDTILVYISLSTLDTASSSRVHLIMLSKAFRIFLLILSILPLTSGHPFNVSLIYPRSDRGSALSERAAGYRSTVYFTNWYALILSFRLL
jgi:hypothetical protein